MTFHADDLFIQLHK
jgi:hypothetical protein